MVGLSEQPDGPPEGRIMNLVIFLILCVTLIRADDSADISFMYGFLGNLKSNPDSTVVLFDSSTVHTEDEIIINVGYANNTYFYLIYLDSEGNYSLNDPIDLSKLLINGNEPDTIYPPPVLRGKLKIPTGDETFYLINSRTALTELIGLFGQYDNDKTPKKLKAKLAKQIQIELDSLNPENKQNLASIDSRLDKPVVGGVTFRGDEEDELKNMSLTQSCRGNSEIAFKKIILNHQ